MGSQTWEKTGILPACTLREALSRYLDITAVVSRHLLHQLASLATDDQQRQKLLQIAQVGFSRLVF